MIERDVDILIVGGGLVGAMLWLALKDLPYRTVLVDATPLAVREHADFDARTLALSQASIRILHMLSIWSDIEAKASPIRTIHVSEEGVFGQARLDETADPLGYVIELHDLMRAISGALFAASQSTDPEAHDVIAPAEVLAFDAEKRHATVKLDSGTVLFKAKLVVAADGAHSPMRRFCHMHAEVKEYGQHAVVANLGLKRSHHQVAYERFSKQGPMALLPMTQSRSALIWSTSLEHAQQLKTCSDDDFLRSVQQRFGYRLGALRRVGQRQVFPIQQIYMPNVICNGTVFIGNAAHTLHPVAGQGFNLGLRDVVMLAQCIRKHGLVNAGLDEYQHVRDHDQRSIRLMTDRLVTLFASSFPGMSMLRGCGLIAFDQCSFIKKLLTRYAQGYGGVIPDLVCGVRHD